MGLNAIYAYVGSELLADVLSQTHIGNGSNAATATPWIYEHLFKP